MDYRGGQTHSALQSIFPLPRQSLKPVLLERSERCAGRPSALHGLLLWRRSVVDAFAAAIDAADPIAEWTLLLAAIDAGHAYRRLPIIARHWRRHCGQSHRALS